MSARVETLESPAVRERERVLEILRRATPRLRSRGIAQLSLFGSLARGEAGPGSDVDLLIEIDPAADLGFIELFELKE